MTQWTLLCYDGRAFRLPQPVAWRLEYGLGTPCDSFWVKTLWEGGQEEDLADGYRLRVTEGGETRFFGIVDECQVTWSEEGGTAEISGRGMQGLLLDNQAEGAEFGRATLEEILRRYVTPYGIRLDRPVDQPAWAADFVVGSGSSCWQVVYDFARYCVGLVPRFTREGKLALHHWGDEHPVVLDGAPVTKFVRRDRRYGVLSQVTVRDTQGLARQTEVNGEFAQRGGRCSRVILLPETYSDQARRYRGQFQMDRSMAGLLTFEVTLALPFAAWPGDLVELPRNNLAGTQWFRVRESRVSLGEAGYETTLLLGDPNAVL